MNSNNLILLVEDNSSDARLTLHTLEKAGIANEIVLAKDGNEALDYLFGTGKYAGRNAASLPALIILDLKMPKVDGFEVLKRVRSDPRTRRQPIVVLTSSKEDRDICESYNLGANSYVSKPVEFQEFTEAVKKLGLYWLVLNEHPTA
jgi:two-component system response regulator